MDEQGPIYAGRLHLMVVDPVALDAMQPGHSHVAGTRLVVIPSGNDDQNGTLDNIREYVAWAWPGTTLVRVDWVEYVSNGSGGCILRNTTGPQPADHAITS